MDKILIVSLGKRAIEANVNQLRKYVGENMKVAGKAVRDLTDSDIRDCIVVPTSEYIYELIRGHIDESANVIVARRTISYKNLKPLFNIKQGSKILVVNDDEYSCREAVSQLLSLGFDGMNYQTYYPGIQFPYDYDEILTLGEAQLIPSSVNNFIDLGIRKIDITTIVEILNKLKLMDEKGNVVSADFVSDMVGLTRHFSKMNKDNSEMSHMLNMMLDMIPIACAFVDGEGNVIYENGKFGVLKDLDDSICSMVIDQYLNKNKQASGKIITIEDQSYIYDIKDLTKESSGYYITLQSYEEIYKKEKNMRIQSKLLRSNLIYTFEDIKTSNKKMKEVIRRARSMSKSSSTIMITGESGTGKEMLAQSIHNESSRRDEPFIAVNFASISPSLIESELFGYVEGAFTGASRHGKQGLFEIAHNGTIFLDEIGDAPLSIQGSLLRVLQEGLVRRVGGHSLIPIDVRVISATNKDLRSLVKEGLFREDLYYRINVLPIETISLKDRKEDILVLLSDFLGKFEHKEVDLYDYFEKEVVEMFSLHPWIGNIRELINITEYCYSLKTSSEKITLNDLPGYFIEEMNEKEIANITDGELDDMILEILTNNEGVGRRRIKTLIAMKGYKVSENSIRKRIDSLHKLGKIKREGNHFKTKWD